MKNTKKQRAVILSALLLTFTFAAVSCAPLEFGPSVINRKTAETTDETAGDTNGGETAAGETVTDEITDEMMDTIVAVLNRRLTAAGYTEATVNKIGNKHRVRVDIPDADDLEEAIRLVGATAQLYFIDSDGNIVLTGQDVVSAKMENQQDPTTGAVQPIVALKLNDSARQRFADATERMAAKTQGENYIAILLDNELISMPSVSARIDSTDCIITGADAEEAKMIVNLISSGSLPCALSIVETRNLASGVSVTLEATMDDAEKKTDEETNEQENMDSEVAYPEEVNAAQSLYFFDSDGTVVLGMNNIEDAKAKSAHDESNNLDYWVVELTVDDEGRENMADATERMAEKPEGENYIAIMLDGELISTPSVSERIDRNVFVITGTDEEEAKTIAAMIHWAISAE